MSIKAAFQYQLADHKNSVITYWGIIIVVFSVIAVCMATGVSDSVKGIRMTGTDSATAIFLFISGLCAFKEPFLMMMQNGVSRKSVFLSRILANLSLAAFMAALEKILLLAGKGMMPSSGVFKFQSIFESAYNSLLPRTNAFLLHSVLFTLDFLVNAACLTAGLFITILFYRLNKAGKIAVGAGVPVLLFAVLPGVDTLFLHSFIYRFFSRLFVFAFGNPYAAMLSFVILSVVLSLFCWILMRRAVVKL